MNFEFTTLSAHFFLCLMLSLLKYTAFYDISGKIVGTYGVPMPFQFSFLVYLSFIVERTIIFFLYRIFSGKGPSPLLSSHLFFHIVKQRRMFNRNFSSNFCLSAAKHIAYNLILSHTPKD